MDKKYAYLAADETFKLLAIDSPSGFTKRRLHGCAADFRDSDTRRGVR